MVQPFTKAFYKVKRGGLHEGALRRDGFTYFRRGGHASEVAGATDIASGFYYDVNDHPIPLGTPPTPTKRVGGNGNRLPPTPAHARYFLYDPPP